MQWTRKIEGGGHRISKMSKWQTKLVLLTFEVCTNHFYIEYLFFRDFTRAVSEWTQVDNSSYITFLSTSNSYLTCNPPQNIPLISTNLPSAWKVFHWCNCGDHFHNLCYIWNVPMPTNPSEGSSPIHYQVQH